MIPILISILILLSPSYLVSASDSYVVCPTTTVDASDVSACPVYDAAPPPEPKTPPHTSSVSPSFRAKFYSPFTALIGNTTACPSGSYTSINAAMKKLLLDYVPGVSQGNIPVLLQPGVHVITEEIPVLSDILVTISSISGDPRDTIITTPLDPRVTASRNGSIGHNHPDGGIFRAGPKTDLTFSAVTVVNRAWAPFLQDVGERHSPPSAPEKGNPPVIPGDKQIRFEGLHVCNGFGPLLNLTFGAKLHLDEVLVANNNIIVSDNGYLFTIDGRPVDPGDPVHQSTVSINRLTVWNNTGRGTFLLGIFACDEVHILQTIVRDNALYHLPHTSAMVITSAFINTLWDDVVVLNNEMIGGYAFSPLDQQGVIYISGNKHLAGGKLTNADVVFRNLTFYDNLGQVSVTSRDQNVTFSHSRFSGRNFPGKYIDVPTLQAESTTTFIECDFMDTAHPDEIIPFIEPLNAPQQLPPPSAFASQQPRHLRRDREYQMSNSVIQQIYDARLFANPMHDADAHVYDLKQDGVKAGPPSLLEHILGPEGMARRQRTRERVGRDYRERIQQSLRHAGHTGIIGTYTWEDDGRVVGDAGVRSLEPRFHGTILAGNADFIRCNFLNQAKNSTLWDISIFDDGRATFSDSYFLNWASDNMIFASAGSVHIHIGQSVIQSLVFTDPYQAFPQAQYRNRVFLYLGGSVAATVLQSTVHGDSLTLITLTNRANGVVQDTNFFTSHFGQIGVSNDVSTLTLRDVFVKGHVNEITGVAGGPVLGNDVTGSAGRLSVTMLSGLNVTGQFSHHVVTELSSSQEEVADKVYLTVARSHFWNITFIEPVLYPYQGNHASVLPEAIRIFFPRGLVVVRNSVFEGMNMSCLATVRSEVVMRDVWIRSSNVTPYESARSKTTHLPGSLLVQNSTILATNVTMCTHKPLEVGCVRQNAISGSFSSDVNSTWYGNCGVVRQPLKTTAGDNLPVISRSQYHHLCSGDTVDFDFTLEAEDYGVELNFTCVRIDAQPLPGQTAPPTDCAKVHLHVLFAHPNSGRKVSASGYGTSGIRMVRSDPLFYRQSDYRLSVVASEDIMVELSQLRYKTSVDLRWSSVSMTSKFFSRIPAKLGFFVGGTTYDVTVNMKDQFEEPLLPGQTANIFLATGADTWQRPYGIAQSIALFAPTVPDKTQTLTVRVTTRGQESDFREFEIRTVQAALFWSAFGIGLVCLLLIVVVPVFLLYRRQRRGLTEDIEMKTALLNEYFSSNSVKVQTDHLSQFELGQAPVVFSLESSHLRPMCEYPGAWHPVQMMTPGVSLSDEEVGKLFDYMQLLYVTYKCSDMAETDFCLPEEIIQTIDTDILERQKVSQQSTAVLQQETMLRRAADLDLEAVVSLLDGLMRDHAGDPNGAVNTGMCAGLHRVLLPNDQPCWVCQVHKDETRLTGMRPFDISTGVRLRMQPYVDPFASVDMGDENPLYYVDIPFDTTDYWGLEVVSLIREELFRSTKMPEHFVPTRVRVLYNPVLEKNFNERYRALGIRGRKKFQRPWPREFAQVQNIIISELRSHLRRFAHGDGADSNVNLDLAFHGTQGGEDNAMSIARYGCLSLGQRNHGWHGQGSYFTHFPEYGEKYTQFKNGSIKVNDEGERVLLMCWLLLGQTFPVPQRMDRPTDPLHQFHSGYPGHDSGFALVQPRGPTATQYDPLVYAFDELVIAQENQILPRFLLYYKAKGE